MTDVLIDLLQGAFVIGIIVSFMFWLVLFVTWIATFDLGYAPPRLQKIAVVLPIGIVSLVLAYVLGSRL